MSDNTQTEKGILLLQDGTVYYGIGAGFKGTSTGEVCFNTGMTGYQEIFTDPSYSNQVLVLTNVHIGNYGISEVEIESNKIQIAGLICRNFANEYFRKQADRSLQDYLESNKLVCIHNIDTRSLVRNVRDKGAMNCIISNDGTSIAELKKLLKSVPDMSGLELASKVCTSDDYCLGSEDASFKVAVLDFGVKNSILKNIVDRDCYIKVFNAKSSFETLSSFSPDGIFLSNGPGDPDAMDYAISTTRKIINSEIPVFGICLGHQIIAKSMGIKTYKMHNGHRGINHPVINLSNGKCEITSQNHGFGVDAESVRSLSGKVEITHVNLNDDTVEGIKLVGKDVFSVQYHPESSPGPHDSRYLFDQFITNIKNSKK